MPPHSTLVALPTLAILTMGVGSSSSSSIALSLHKLWVINEAVLVLVVLIEYRIDHVHQLEVGEQFLLWLWMASFAFVVGRVMPVEEGFDELLAVQLVVVVCIVHLEVVELQLLVGHAGSIDGHLQVILDVVTLAAQVRVVQHALVVAASSVWLLLYLLRLLELLLLLLRRLLRWWWWLELLLLWLLKLLLLLILLWLLILLLLLLLVLLWGNTRGLLVLLRWHSWGARLVVTALLCHLDSLGLLLLLLVLVGRHSGGYSLLC